MILRKHSIPKAVATVFLFWFVILLGLDFNLADTAELKKTGFQTLTVAAGIVAGIFFAYRAEFLRRRKKELSIKGGAVRGLQSNLGLPPIHLHELKKAAAIPQGQALEALQPPEFAGTDYIETWRRETAKSHPAYVALFDDVLKTLSAPEYAGYPATHHTAPPKNHGLRSLVTHSLLVSQLMLLHAPFFHYKPFKGRKLKDKNYLFDPNDPLIPIIGLAHDLGKIECLVFKDGKAVDMRPNHAQIGARAIARTDAFWHPQIDGESRRFLSMIIAFYHTPQEMPTDEKGNVLSDRLHALLELLILCDKQAGQIENGLTDRMYSAKNQRDIEAMMENFEESREQTRRRIETGAMSDGNGTVPMETAIFKVLNERNRINGSDNYSIGIRCAVKDYPGSYVLLNEERFVAAVAQEMGVSVEDYEMITDEKYGDKQDMRQKGKAVNDVKRFTREVLKMLSLFPIAAYSEDEDGNVTVTHQTHNILATFEEEGMIRNPELAVYKADFVEGRWFTDQHRNKFKGNYRIDGVVNEKREGWFSWASVIALNADRCPENLEAVCKSENSKRLTAVITGARMGRIGLKTEREDEAERARLAVMAEATAAAGGDTVQGNIAMLESLLAQPKPKAKTPKVKEEAPATVPVSEPETAAAKPKADPTDTGHAVSEDIPPEPVTAPDEAENQPQGDTVMPSDEQAEPAVLQPANPIDFHSVVRRIYRKHRKELNEGIRIETLDGEIPLTVSVAAWDRAGQKGEPDQVCLIEADASWLAEHYGVQVKRGENGLTYNVNSREWMPAAGIKRILLDDKGRLTVYCKFKD